MGAREPVEARKERPLGRSFLAHFASPLTSYFLESSTKTCLAQAFSVSKTPIPLGATAS
jgi:hypothetical protein